MGCIYPKRGARPVLFREAMSSVLLRDAVAADDAAIGEMLVEAFVLSYAQKLPDVVVTDRRKVELRDVASKRAAAKVWVAELAGVVVGTVSMWPPGSPRTEAWISDAADLRHLAVSATQRGRGVSKVLLDQAEAWGRAMGFAGVCLHVRREATGVGRIYVARGYERRPEGDLDLLPEVFLEAYFLPFGRSWSLLT